MNRGQNTKHAVRATHEERQFEKKAGRAAARRNALKLPRAIRVGPNKGAEKNLGSLYRGFIYFSSKYRGFIPTSLHPYIPTSLHPYIPTSLDKPPVS